MGVLSTIFGVGEAAGGAASAVTAVGNVIDELITSDEERLDKQALLTRLAQQPNLAQVELNKVEAGHRSIFVAGWRPAIGWVCAGSLAYQFMISPMIAWGFLLWHITHPGSAELPPPPGIDFAPLMAIVMSLLGLGGLRTVEKRSGRAK